MNAGLAFEWCIFHNIAMLYPDKFSGNTTAKTAKANFEASTETVKKGAKHAIDLIQEKYGKILDIEKKSGGGIEPKTDLLITTKSKKIRCSLKYGGDIQLSSGGIANTVRFLTGVLENLKYDPGISNSQVIRILSILAELDNNFGDLGKLPREIADKKIGETQNYNQLLQEILGSSRSPKVSEQYRMIKYAIIEEAITGKYTFKNDVELSADHILSEDKLEKIDSDLIKKIANKTSVRIALKGRGKKTVGSKEIRMNEIVVRFDTKA